MLNLHRVLGLTCLFAWIAALGCGIPTMSTGDASDMVTDMPTDTPVEPPPDGPPPRIPDLSCLGAPSPTTAPDPLTVTGIVANPQGGAEIANVLLEAILRSDGSVVASDTTGTGATTGAYTLSIATGGIPWDGYFRLTEATRVSTYVFPPAPLSADQSALELPMVTPTQINLVGSLVGKSVRAGTSAAIVGVVDCIADGVEGATVAFTPPAGRIGYIMGMLPSSTATATDRSGVAIGVNIPADATGMPVSVSADYMGTTLGPLGLLSFSDSLLVTFVSP